MCGAKAVQTVELDPEDGLDNLRKRLHNVGAGLRMGFTEEKPLAFFGGKWKMPACDEHAKWLSVRANVRQDSPVAVEATNHGGCIAHFRSRVFAEAFISANR